MTPYATSTPQPVYETKAGGTAAAFDDFMRTFEAFKEANDSRLDEIEARVTADVVTSDRVERIGRALDEQKRVLDTLASKAQRPPLEGAAPRAGATDLQHKQAFDAYVRSGDASRLRGLERKALSVGSDPDGGYLVPDEVEAPPTSASRSRSSRAIAASRSTPAPSTRCAAPCAPCRATKPPASIAPTTGAPRAARRCRGPSPSFISTPPSTRAWGLNITAELVQQLGEGVVQVTQAAGGLAGTALAIWGRMRATTTLTRTQVNLTI